MTGGVTVAHPEDGQNGTTAHGFYDYCLKGTANFAADRAMVHKAERMAPGTIRKIRDARNFALGTAVWSVREQGVTSVIEHGAWLPGRGRPLHEVVRSVKPETTVVYTQRDEVAASHLDELAADVPGVWSVHAASLPMCSMLPVLRQHSIIGKDERACVMLEMLLHFFGEGTCREAITENAALLPPGSVIVVSMVMPENPETARRMADAFPRAIYPYTPADLAAWMTGAGLRLAGAVTDVQSWSPHDRVPRFAAERSGRIAGAVGVVP